MLRNRSVPDVKVKRETWIKHMQGSAINNLVFLDESGVNTDMTRHYARSKSNERAVDSAPVNTPRNTTILSSIRLNGKAAHTVYQGRTTAERFAEYLKNILLPTLSKDDIIVMDNMRSHHAKAVKKSWTNRGTSIFTCHPTARILTRLKKCSQRSRHI